MSELATSTLVARIKLPFFSITIFLSSAFIEFFEFIAYDFRSEIAISIRDDSALGKGSSLALMRLSFLLGLRFEFSPGR